MDYVYFKTFFLGVVLLSFCSGDDTVDAIYKILSSKIDNIHFDIRNLRNEVNDNARNAEQNGRTKNFEELSELQQTIETWKTEIEERFENLENKITLNVNEYLEENRILLSEKLSREVKQHVNGLRKALSSEKKHLRNIARSFALKFEDSEQVIGNIIRQTQLDMTNATNAFGRRIEDVEEKMFAFENASWKGEKGDTGETGPMGLTGPTGNIGSQGHKGHKGEEGPSGYSGSKGQKGQKGSPESRKSVHFSVRFNGNSIALTDNKILKYDNVLRNTGSGYSKTTGKFTAPYSGVYLFLLFAQAGEDENDTAYLELYTDGYYRAYAVAESSYDGQGTSGGNAYITFMSAGDEAWVQTGGLLYRNTHRFWGHGTTFTGVLLYVN